MRNLSIHLFGELQIKINDQPVIGFDSKKTQALLIYLAVESHRAHLRDVLAEMFWPNKPEGMGRQNLRQALANLRKVIGDRDSQTPFFLTTRDEIQFNHEAEYWLDSSSFHTAMTQVENLSKKRHNGNDSYIKYLQQAATLYTGDFLEQFFIDDSPSFSEWIQICREKYKRQAITAFQHLVKINEQNNNMNEALIFCQRWAELDHWGEEAHRQLMRLLALQGQRNDALAHYKKLQNELADELDIEPEEDTTKLYELIREGSLREPPIRPNFLIGTEINAEAEYTVCIAREKEITKLNAHLSKVLEGCGQVVFVTGNVGQGKTTIIKKFIQDATESNPSLLAATGYCNAYAGFGEPYLPFRDIMATLTADIDPLFTAGRISPQLAQRIWTAFPLTLEALLDQGKNLIDTFVPSERLLSLAVLAGVDASTQISLLSDYKKYRQEGNQELEQIQIFEQFTNVLRRLSANHPLILTVEDLHWADQASISLLFHLGHRIESSRILIVCSYRPEEMNIPKEDKRHPVESVLTEFKRRYGDIYVHLDMTGEKERSRFVNELLDSEKNQYSDGFRDNLYRHTGGQPLFTVELLRHLRDIGIITKDEDECWKDNLDFQWNILPAKVEGVIENRIYSLDERLREILGVASVEGEVFTAQVVSKVLDIEEIDMLQMLSKDLERDHNLVIEEAEIESKQGRMSRYRFNHILFQQFLYERLSQGERRLLHGKVATSLEDLLPDDHEALSHHFLKAGKNKKALKYLAKSGENALRMYAFEEAEAYFKSALNLVADDKMKADLLAGLGDTLFGRGFYNEANDSWRESIELYIQQGNLDRSAWLYARSARSKSLIGDLPTALEICIQGKEILDGVQPCEGMASLLHETARVYLFYGLRDEFISLCEQALTMAEQVGSNHVQADALITQGLDNSITFEESLTLFHKAAKIANSVDALDLAAKAFHAMGVVFSFAGELEKGKKIFKQSADLFTNSGNLNDTIWSILNYAINDIHIGNLSQAREMITKAQELSQIPNPDAYWWKYQMRSTEAYLALAQGERNTALEIYQAVWSDLNKIGHKFALSEIGSKLGWTLLELGENEAAEGILKEVLELEGVKEFYWFCTPLSFLAIKSLRENDLESATNWIEKAQNHDLERKERNLIDTTFPLLAEAHLFLAKEEWEKAIASFNKFDQMAQQVGLRWWQVRAQWDLAEAYIMRDNTGDKERGIEIMRQVLVQFKEMDAIGWVNLFQKRLETVKQQ